MEIAALVQLTKGGRSLMLLSDVSVGVELLVAGNPTALGGSEPNCGLWLLNPPTGQVRKLAEGALSYSSGAFFSPRADRVLYSAIEDCPFPITPETLQTTDVGMWVLDLQTMERSTLYENGAPLPRDWRLDGRLLVTRNMQDGEGWTLWLHEYTSLPKPVLL